MYSRVCVIVGFTCFVHYSKLYFAYRNTVFLNGLLALAIKTPMFSTTHLRII